MQFRERMNRRFTNKGEKGDDFGFTNRISDSAQRILNQNGSFNVIRVGEKKLIFHELLTMSWTHFLGYILAYYALTNLFFAGLYLLVDFNGIGMTSDYEVQRPFLIAFYFSAQTLTTVGYGSLYPLSAPVSTLAAFEALIGLMGFAIFTGLMYGRFSKTPHSIRFSKHALVAPYKDGIGIMFRAANERNHNLTELEVKVTLAIITDNDGKPGRKFFPLPIDNNRITYFPLNWTMVHNITAESPLYGMREQDFAEADMELLIMVKGYNETTSQEVHARFSYTQREIVYGAKYLLPYYFREDGITIFELDKIDNHEPAELPEMQAITQ
ncbi:MAG TPA: ion channel [Chitinophagales bacterium]|nr:ion channel [Chitinophagales bacterium]